MEKSDKSEKVQKVISTYTEMNAKSHSNVARLLQLFIYLCYKYLLKRKKKRKNTILCLD
jgi:hypothetical protein